MRQGAAPSICNPRHSFQILNLGNGMGRPLEFWGCFLFIVWYDSKEPQFEILRLVQR